jgi:hypothetical protein
VTVRQATAHSVERKRRLGCPAIRRRPPLHQPPDAARQPQHDPAKGMEK